MNERLGFSSADTKSDVRAALIGCTRLALELTGDCTRPWRPAAHEPLTPIETRCYRPNRSGWSLRRPSCPPRRITSGAPDEGSQISRLRFRCRSRSRDPRGRRIRLRLLHGSWHKRRRLPRRYSPRFRGLHLRDGWQRHHHRVGGYDYLDGGTGDDHIDGGGGETPFSTLRQPRACTWT
jgi:hypothetical protein